MKDENRKISQLLTEVLAGKSSVSHAFASWPNPESVECELYGEIWHLMSHYVEDEDIWAKDSEYHEYYIKQFQNYLRVLKS